MIIKWNASFTSGMLNIIMLIIYQYTIVSCIVLGCIYWRIIGPNPVTVTHKSVQILTLVAACPAAASRGYILQGLVDWHQ